METPHILYEDSSPLGNVFAQVEDDGRTVYFYLTFLTEDDEELDEDDSADIDLRACWVRNRLPAPEDSDEEAMNAGMGPLLARHQCGHPDGAPPLDGEALRVVWFEEGNGAALLEGDDLLAVIPPWSGENGFHGYARDCVAESALAWPLDDDNQMHARVQRADEYWGLWDDEDCWQDFASQLIDPLEAQFSEDYKYFAIDGDRWPPRALLLFELPERYLLITVGVSLLPQPNVELHVEDPARARRIELAAAIDRDCPTEEVMQLASYMSGQAQFPWTFWTWLGDGHSLPCDSIPPSCGGRKFSAVLLSQQMPKMPPVRWPPFRGDPLNVLWLIPITAGERDWLIEHDSMALVEHLTAAGVDTTIRDRNELKLSEE